MEREARLDRIKQILEGRFGEGMVRVTGAYRDWVNVWIDVIPEGINQAEAWRRESLSLLKEVGVRLHQYRDGGTLRPKVSIDGAGSLL
jgi:hypothetical protein